MPRGATDCPVPNIAAIGNAIDRDCDHFGFDFVFGLLVIFISLIATAIILVLVCWFADNFHATDCDCDHLGFDFDFGFGLLVCW